MLSNEKDPRFSPRREPLFSSYNSPERRLDRNTSDFESPSFPEEARNGSSLGNESAAERQQLHSNDIPLGLGPQDSLSNPDFVGGEADIVLPLNRSTFGGEPQCQRPVEG